MHYSISTRINQHYRVLIILKIH